MHDVAFELGVPVWCGGMLETGIGRSTNLALAALRRHHVALRRGGLRWAHLDDDVIAFVREHPEESVLVVARRTAIPMPDLPLDVGRHLLGTEPGGEGPRLDVWSIT